MEFSDTIKREIKRYHKAGIQLWVEEGRLRYKATQRPLTPMELEKLKQWKRELIQELEQASRLDELDLLIQKLQACLNVQQGVEYKLFSQSTLHQEFLALRRLEDQINKVLAELGCGGKSYYKRLLALMQKDKSVPKVVLFNDDLGKSGEV